MKSINNGNLSSNRIEIVVIQTWSLSVFLVRILSKLDLILKQFRLFINFIQIASNQLELFIVIHLRALNDLLKFILPPLMLQHLPQLRQIILFLMGRGCRKGDARINRRQAAIPSASLSPHWAWRITCHNRIMWSALLSGKLFCLLKVVIAHFPEIFMALDMAFSCFAELQINLARRFSVG